MQRRSEVGKAIGNGAVVTVPSRCDVLRHIVLGYVLSHLIKRTRSVFYWGWASRLSRVDCLTIFLYPLVSMIRSGTDAGASDRGSGEPSETKVHRVLMWLIRGFSHRCSGSWAPFGVDCPNRSRVQYCIPPPPKIQCRGEGTYSVHMTHKTIEQKTILTIWIDKENSSA